MHVRVDSLPQNMRTLLHSLGYRRSDINCEAREKAHRHCGGGDGYRGFFYSPETGVQYGSWGGANAFTKNSVDGTNESDAYVVLRAGDFAVRGTEGGGQPVYASLYAHPDTIATSDGKPCGEHEDCRESAEIAAACATARNRWAAPRDVTDREKTLLSAVSMKSSYRREELRRIKATDGEIDGLVSRGFVSRNKAGAMTLTTEGRNARGSL